MIMPSGWITFEAWKKKIQDFLPFDIYLECTEKQLKLWYEWMFLPDRMIEYFINSRIKKGHKKKQNNG